MSTVETKDNGKQKFYLCDYYYGGEPYSIEIPAASWAEAESRLRNMAYARVVGEIEVSISIPVGPLVAIAAWFKRLVRGMMAP